MTLGASAVSHCVFWVPHSPQPSPSPGDQGGDGSSAWVLTDGQRLKSTRDQGTVWKPAMSNTLSSLPGLLQKSTELFR